MTYPPSSPAEPPEEPTSPIPAYPPDSPPPSYQPGVARPTYPPTANYPVYQPNTTYPAYDPNSAYPGYAGPPRKGRSGLVIGLVIATVLVICAALGVAGTILFVNVAKDVVASGDSPNPQPAGRGATSGPADEDTGNQNEDGQIVLEVSGDGPVAIFYGVGGGKNENLRDVDLPWRITVPRDGDTQVITVLASRVSVTDGEVTCRILLDGTELQKQTKDGKFAIATCITVV
jgi:hypothetical protein